MEHSLILSQTNNAPATINALTKSEIEIVEASKGVKLKEYLPQDKAKLAMEVYFLAKAKLGLNSPSQQEEQATISILLDDLNNFDLFTKEEIIKALKRGLNGEYSTGDFVHFNSSNFVRWVRRYQEEKQIALAKDMKAKQEEEQSIPPPPEEQQRKDAIQVANMYAEMYAENKVGSGISIGKAGFDKLFDLAEKFGLINIPVAQKWEVYNRLKAKYADEEVLKSKCKEFLYDEFIRSMNDFGVRFDESGKLF